MFDFEIHTYTKSKQEKQRIKNEKVKVDRRKKRTDSLNVSPGESVVGKAHHHGSLAHLTIAHNDHFNAAFLLSVSSGLGHLRKRKYDVTRLKTCS